MKNNKKSLDKLDVMNEGVFILGFKLFVILFLMDIFYVFIDIFLLQANFPYDYYHHINLLLLFFHAIKSLIQIFLIFVVVFRWLYHKYYIDCLEKKLIELKGFFYTDEKLIDLKNIREIRINQSILGKLFRYGDIILNATASGGYQEKITLKRIQDPHRNMDLIKSCI